MKRRLDLIAVAALAAAIGTGAALAQSSGGDDHSRQMHEQMMGGMQKMQSMPMSGDIDKDFATMMREHHMQAVEMAKEERAHGKSPEIKKMADKIIKSQKKEIAEFDKWLARHK